MCTRKEPGPFGLFGIFIPPLATIETVKHPCNARQAVSETLRFAGLEEVNQIDQRLEAPGDELG